jgi:mono/diheme cytochrome c family protein
MEGLQAGRATYVSKCAGCHHLHRPEEYAPAEWPGLVAKMAPRAKLSADERRLIATYLSATSARLREPATAETTAMIR